MVEETSLEPGPSLRELRAAPTVRARRWRYGRALAADFRRRGPDAEQPGSRHDERASHSPARAGWRPAVHDYYRALARRVAARGRRRGPPRRSWFNRAPG